MITFDGKKNPDRRKALEEEGHFDTEAFVDWEFGDPRTPMEITAKEYRKTSTTFAVQMAEAFQVETVEGLMTGKAGDFLAIGQAGEMYPVDGAVFAATYEEVES